MESLVFFLLLQVGIVTLSLPTSLWLFTQSWVSRGTEHCHIPVLWELTPFELSSNSVGIVYRARETSYRQLGVCHFVLFILHFSNRDSHWLRTRVREETASSISKFLIERGRQGPSRSSFLHSN